jgi:phage antirepressor YoqD-like protein
MNKYKLINDNRANEFTAELKELLTDKKLELEKLDNNIKEQFFEQIPINLEQSLSEWIKAHKDNKWVETKREKGRSYHHSIFYPLAQIEVPTEFKSNENTLHTYGEFNALCQEKIRLSESIKKFETNISIIENSNLDNSNELVNDYLGDDSLSFNETLFCMLGINPNLLIRINIVSLAEFKERKGDDRLLLAKLTLTREFRKLSKAPRVSGTYGFIINSTVYTNRLTEWLVNKGFIYEDRDQSNSSTTETQINTGGNIKGLNEEKRRSEIHNSVIAVCAFLELQKKNKKVTINSACKGGEFYKNIVEDLTPITKEGKKPSKGVIQKYLYKYNNFIEKS